MRRIELLAHRVGAEDGGERGAWLDDLYRRECARISEHDASAVLEIENEPGEARKLFLDATDDPIAGHSEVDVQRRPVIEHRELVLAATLDARDRSADETSQARLAEIPPNVRVEHCRANDARSHRCTREGTRGMLDLRKLRHERQRILVDGHPQARAIDSAARARRV